MKVKKIARVSGAIALVCTLAFGGYLVKVSASPASGVTRTLIGRGTYGRFMVNTSENQTLNPTDPTVKPFQYIAMAQALGNTEPSPRAHCSERTFISGVTLAPSPLFKARYAALTG